MNIVKRVIMGGITGKTGNAVARFIQAAQDFDLVAAVGNTSVGKDIGEILGSERNGRLVYPDVVSALKAHPADVYVDFTNLEAVERNLLEALEGGLDLIVGTTGIRGEFVEHLAQKVELAGRFATIFSNFSLGIVVLGNAAQTLGAFFGPENIEIVETHHVSKVDKPSGTALYLQKRINAKEEKPVRILSIRVPDRISRHEIRVRMDDLSLSLEHEVTNPDTFGSGVLYVLRNACGKVGVYRDMAIFVDDTEKSRE